MATQTATEIEYVEEHEIGESAARHDTQQETAVNDASDPTSPSSAEPEFPTGVKLWFVMVTVGAVLILVSVDMNIVATAVPSITDHFHTVADVGWYSSAFRLCACAFQFMFGKAYKLFSVKRVFLLANVVSIVGSRCCARRLPRRPCWSSAELWLDSALLVFFWVASSCCSRRCLCGDDPCSSASWVASKVCPPWLHRCSEVS